MAFEKPRTTRSQIDRAGLRVFDTSLSPDDQVDALVALLNWRAAHSYPLNALTMTLRNRATKIDNESIVAQRLKRSDSIMRKLLRQSSMQMSRMQDVGGCRAIMSDLGGLLRLFRLYVENPLRHELTNVKDYVSEPKPDGYRSIHLMYRFSGRASSLPWDKLRIEIQLRTKLQHSWATAVETVDAFTGQSLKFGSGSGKWEELFARIASVHAMYEGTPPVPGTPGTLLELRSEISDIEAELHVINSLRSYAHLTQSITKGKFGDNFWYVLVMDPDRNRTVVQPFAQRDFDKAKIAYDRSEREVRGTKGQAVLVSAVSLVELKKAYPNYFADTEYFSSTLSDFLMNAPLDINKAMP